MSRRRLRAQLAAAPSSHTGRHVSADSADGAGSADDADAAADAAGDGTAARDGDDAPTAAGDDGANGAAADGTWIGADDADASDASGAPVTRWPMRISDCRAVGRRRLC